MVSYDNHDFVLNLYPDKSKVLYQLSQCASNRMGDEVVIFDDRLYFEQAITNLKNPQTI